MAATSISTRPFTTRALKAVDPRITAQQIHSAVKQRKVIRPLVSSFGKGSVCILSGQSIAALLVYRTALAAKIDKAVAIKAGAIVDGLADFDDCIATGRTLLVLAADDVFPVPMTREDAQEALSNAADFGAKNGLIPGQHMPAELAARGISIIDFGRTWRAVEPILRGLCERQQHCDQADAG